MVMQRTWTVESLGIGHPDYTRDVSASRERPGILLKFNQTLVQFALVMSAIPSPFAFVTAPLGAGLTTNAIDTATGLALPYTVPAGFTLTAFAAKDSFTEDVIMWAYFDGFLYGTFGAPTGGSVGYVAHIVAPSTAQIDPTGATAHTLNITLTNMGGAAVQGGAAIFGILEEVGTEPLPTTKVVKCKYCGHETTVPKGTTEVTCSECGETTLYFDLSNIREF